MSQKRLLLVGGVIAGAVIAYLIAGAIIAVVWVCVAGGLAVARRRRLTRRTRARDVRRGLEESERAAAAAEATGASSRDVRICFVCLGNICRSPTAEAVMRHRVAEAGLDGAIAVESAGTGSWHVGGPADPRAAAEVRARGIPIDGAARQFIAPDFARFDLIVAMDAQNAADLQAMAPDAGEAAKVRLLREFDPTASGDRSVPDPYYGGPEGFAEVFDMIDRACLGLIEHLRARTAAQA